VSNSILPVPRVVDDLFAEHCLADPIVVSIPERITGLKLRPGIPKTRSPANENTGLQEARDK
jgi:hypothetical protein